jgi:hypothetical protein
VAQESLAYGEDVERLRRRFAEWRGTHAVRARLPEELWAAAAELAERDGMDATARALEVDKPSLRKWADRLRPQRQPRSRRLPPKQRGNAVPAFVELLAAGSGATASCLIEVESPRGSKLRLELKAIATSQLAELIRTFAIA